jgi:hypothetical protein
MSKLKGDQIRVMFANIQSIIFPSPLLSKDVKVDYTTIILHVVLYGS